LKLIAASQWFNLGDISDIVGPIELLFEEHEDYVCPFCGRPFSRHGVIRDTLSIVCPGNYVAFIEADDKVEVISCSPGLLQKTFPAKEGEYL